MKVLAINGSPRKTGNTASLIEKTLDGARAEGADTRRIDLAEMQIKAVREEDYTASLLDVSKGFSDDLKGIIEAISSSDALILASPIFFGSITGEMKIMIDRFQFAWLEKNLRQREVFSGKKKGAFISVQAQARPDFFNNASSIVRHFFATVNISYSEELFCCNLEKKTDAGANTDYMKKAFELGRRLGACTLL